MTPETPADNIYSITSHNVKKGVFSKQNLHFVLFYQFVFDQVLSNSLIPPTVTRGHLELEYKNGFSE